MLTITLYLLALVGGVFYGGFLLWLKDDQIWLNRVLGIFCFLIAAVALVELAGIL